MSDPIPPVSSTTDFYRPLEVFVVHPPKQRYWIHILLLLATIFTTLVVGARMQTNFLHKLPVLYTGDDGLSIFPVIWALHAAHLTLGIPFSLTLMLILLAHEMGHYLYCRRYRVWATLPFFIPFPTLIGTLGAFIRIRSPIRSRSALFDIGIAGPIAGFAAAVTVLFFSLGFAQPISAGVPPASIELGLPLNLLPGGQLDGGHIVFSLAPRAHRVVSALTILVLIPLAYYLWVGWLLWAVLLGLSGMRHPMVPEWPAVDRPRRWLALGGLGMLILTWTPTPILHNSLPEVIRQLRSGQ
jgi:membrane-associated protease RseP (regulator of RpoE activity)